MEHTDLSVDPKTQKNIHQMSQSLPFGEVGGAYQCFTVSFIIFPMAIGSRDWKQRFGGASHPSCTKKQNGDRRLPTGIFIKKCLVIPSAARELKKSDDLGLRSKVLGIGLLAH